MKVTKRTHHSRRRFSLIRGRRHKLSQLRRAIKSYRYRAKPAPRKHFVLNDCLSLAIWYAGRRLAPRPAAVAQ